MPSCSTSAFRGATVMPHAKEQRAARNPPFRQ
nr:MAG TPA: hypothetical protein [Caudoviricetes sp.]